MPEADVPLDVVLAGRLLDVAQDRRRIGDRTILEPGLERVAERVQVRVRAHAGIAEQIPGAAERVACLEDQVALFGLPAGQVGGGSDPGDPGADDQDVDVLGLHARLCRSDARTASRSSLSSTVQ